MGIAEGEDYSIEIAEKTASPGRMREATLIGPDEKSLIFAYDAATAKEAKRAWSASSGCSIEHIQLLLADGTELEDTAELPSGDVSVRYSLAGAGMPFGCQVDVKFDCETNFPGFIALGLCCNHCWASGYEDGWIKGGTACCADHVWCFSSDCGLHKLWKCEVCCLGMDCGSGLCDLHKPTMKNTTDFPDFVRLGLCCNHCWLNSWCCSYWSAPFGDHCSSATCLCCHTTCGMALLGFAELFCAQLECFHCQMTDPHSSGHIPLMS